MCLPFSQPRGGNLYGLMEHREEYTKLYTAEHEDEMKIAYWRGIIKLTAE
jgi:hypothetical protein